MQLLVPARPDLLPGTPEELQLGHPTNDSLRRGALDEG